MLKNELIIVKCNGIWYSLGDKYTDGDFDAVQEQLCADFNNVGINSYLFYGFDVEYLALCNTSWNGILYRGGN
jgi:hypothetical protein